MLKAIRLYVRLTLVFRTGIKAVINNNIPSSEKRYPNWLNPTAPCIRSVKITNTKVPIMTRDNLFFRVYPSNNKAGDVSQSAIDVVVGISQGKLLV